MSNYTPGEGYDKGFICRMNGGDKPQQAQIPLNTYWQEYALGWDEADNKIITEARKRNIGSKPKILREITNQKEI